jgi:hypothetical protein
LEDEKVEGGWEDALGVRFVGLDAGGGDVFTGSNLTEFVLNLAQWWSKLY